MRGLIKEVTSLIRVMTTKPVWLCGLAITLWGLNALSLQEVCFEHRGTIAISHSRLAALDSMARKFGSGTPYRLLECELCPEEALSKHQSDMRTVRLRVRAKSHSDLLKLDEFLLQATQPTKDSPESQLILRELRNAKWIRETAVHQQSRVEYQNETCHEQLTALQTHTNSEPTDQGPNAPFQFVGYRSNDNAIELNDQDQSEPIQSQIANLASLSQSIGDQLSLSDERIESLSSRLDASRTHTAGYLSFTGSQDYSPIATPVGWSRLSTACLVFVSAWALVGLMAQRSPVIWSDFKTFVLALAKSKSRQNPRGAKSKSKGIGLGIPCLGTIGLPAEMIGDICSSQQIEPMPESETNVRELRSVGQVDTNAKASLLMNDWLQNAATLAIATWGLMFGIRFLVDSVWRDLFVEAPLAGIIHLLTGAP